MNWNDFIYCSWDRGAKYGRTIRDDPCIGYNTERSKNIRESENG